MLKPRPSNIALLDGTVLRAVVLYSLENVYVVHLEDEPQVLLISKGFVASISK